MNPNHTPNPKIALGFASRPAFTLEEAREIVSARKEAAPRSLEEQRILLSKVKSLAQMWTGRFDFEFLPSPEGGWAVGCSDEAAEVVDEILNDPKQKPEAVDALPKDLFAFKQFHYSEPVIAQYSEDVSLGSTHHECAHIKWTDMRTTFKGQIHARMQGRLPIVFANLQNALEDVWINQKEAAESPTAHQRIERSRLEYTPELVLTIGEQTKLRQLGLNILHHWFFGENIPTLTDRDVLETFDKIKPFLPEYFYGSDPESNYRVLRDKIYPLVKSLEQKDIQQRAELSSLPGQSGASQSSDNPNGGTSSPSSAVGKGIEALKNGIQSLFGLRKSNGGGGSGSESSTPGQPQQAPSDPSQGASSGGAEGKLPGLGQASVGPTPEQLEEARRKFESLPEAEKQRLLEEAKKWLEGEIAKKLKNELPGGLAIEQDPKTGELRVIPKKGLSGKQLTNARARAANAQAEPAQPAPTSDQPEGNGSAADGAMMGFAEGEASAASEYRTLEGQSRAAVDHFKRVIQANAPKADEDVFSGAFMTGSKINQQRLAQNRVSGLIYQRLDATKLEQPNLVCGLVLDNSISMQEGEKLQGSRVGAVSLARVTRMLGIPFSITLFDSKAATLKSPSQDFDDPRQRIKPKLVTNFDASGSGTDISVGLESCMAEVKPLLNRDRDTRALIFLVSDSGANQGKTGAALADYVKSFGPHVRVINFIFGASQHEINEARAVFGERFVVPIDNVNQFGVLAADRLAQVLRGLKSGG